MSYPGDIRCRACGWWPPMVRVRHGRTGPAPDSWRWRQLTEHVFEQADVEAEDGRMDGPHQVVETEMMAIRAAVHQGERT